MTVWSPWARMIWATFVGFSSVVAELPSPTTELAATPAASAVRSISPADEADCAPLDARENTTTDAYSAFLHPRGGALGLGASAAIGAPLRFVEQAFLRVEILLADGPNERVAAFATAQALVREGHRHPPLPGGILIRGSKRSFRSGGQAQPLRERGAWLPEPIAGCPGGIDAGAQDFGGARGRLVHAGRCAEE